MKHALILHSDLGEDCAPDQQDTLVQAREVSGALEAFNFRPVAAPFRGPPVLPSIPDIVFNLVEEVEGREDWAWKAAAWLEDSGIRFTGNPAGTLRACADKIEAKRLMARHGLPTPGWLERGSALPERAGARYIVKSAWLHGSVGIEDDCVVATPEAALARIVQGEERHGGLWFAEEYIEGREFNIALLEDEGAVRVLPIAETQFVGYADDKPRIVGYAAKWHDGSMEFNNTPRRFDYGPEDAGLLEALDEISRACWQAFGMRGYARVDYRVDGLGRPWIIDINPNPCLTSDAGFMAAAGRAGLQPAQVIEKICNAAF